MIISRKWMLSKKLFSKNIISNSSDIFGSNTIDVKPTGSVEMDLGLLHKTR
jgi:hypothetical protein